MDTAYDSQHQWTRQPRFATGELTVLALSNNTDKLAVALLTFRVFFQMRQSSEKKSSNLKPAVVVLLAVLVASLVAVRFGYNYYRLGATNIEVIEAYRERFDPLRKGLHEIASRLNEEPAIDAVVVDPEISPAPVLISGKPLQSNVVVMSIPELMTSEAAELSNLNPEFIFRPDGTQWFETALAWTSDSNPMANSVRDRNGADLKEKLEHALGVQYILLGRIVESGAVSATPAGEVRCDAFLVKIDTGKTVARVPVKVSLSQGVSGEGDPIDQVRRATLLAVKEALGDLGTVE